MPQTWRVEFRNCDYAEGNLQTGIAGERIAGYIFTAGILAIFGGPYHYHPVDAMLTGGDCERLTPLALRQQGHHRTTSRFRTSSATGAGR